MTVAELIEKLKEFPQDAEVWVLEENVNRSPVCQQGLKGTVTL